MLKRVTTVGTALLLVIVAGASSGCDHANPGALSHRIDARARAVSSPSELSVAMQLRPWTLTTHAEFDELEEYFRRRGRTEELLGLYKRMFRTRPDDILLGSRLVLGTLASASENRIRESIGVIESLRAKYPGDGDVQYIAGAVKRIVLHDPVSGTYFVPAQQVSIAERLIEDWKRLVKAHPDYRGPKGVTAEQINKEIIALSEVIEAAGEVTAADAVVDATAANPVDDVKAQGLVQAARFYKIYETEPAEVACREGETALRNGASKAEPRIGELVRAACRLARE